VGGHSCQCLLTSFAYTCRKETLTSVPEVKAEVEVPFISQSTALGESKRGEEGLISSALNPHPLFIPFCEGRTRRAAGPPIHPTGPVVNQGLGCWTSGTTGAITGILMNGLDGFDANRWR